MTPEQEELYLAEQERLDKEDIESLRKDAFPTPSPFGIGYERHRIREVREVVRRWSDDSVRSELKPRECWRDNLRILGILLKRTLGEDFNRDCLSS